MPPTTRARAKTVEKAAALGPGKSQLAARPLTAKSTDSTAEKVALWANTTLAVLPANTSNSEPSVQQENMPRKPPTRVLPRRAYMQNIGVDITNNKIRSEQNAQSSFFRLPTELREMIWAMVLQDSAALVVAPNPSHYRPAVPRSGWESIGIQQYDAARRAEMVLSRFRACRLPQVCRQIYADTARLVYNVIKFEFGYNCTEDLATTWTQKRLSIPYQANAVRSLECHPYWGLETWDKVRRSKALAFLTGFLNLKQLYVVCYDKVQAKVILDELKKRKAKIDDVFVTVDGRNLYKE
ncbi:hypothetical protein GQ44DRAFT_721215 [Phaeosphaeriaceae sp. PMI808]|nr:hypothetical protein GQ44DRAFT_721215 [Phaeosphaeriaceae sp. PMI808]